MISTPGIHIATGSNPVKPIPELAERNDMASSLLATTLTVTQFGWILILTGATLLLKMAFGARIGQTNIQILRGWRIYASQDQDPARFARFLHINQAAGIVAMLVGFGLVLFC